MKDWLCLIGKVKFIFIYFSYLVVVKVIIFIILTLVFFFFNNEICSHANVSTYHLTDDLNFNHNSSIVNKYAEDMKLIHCDYHIDLNSWGGPLCGSDHGTIL